MMDYHSVMKSSEDQHMRQEEDTTNMLNERNQGQGHVLKNSILFYIQNRLIHRNRLAGAEGDPGGCLLNECGSPLGVLQMLGTRQKWHLYNIMTVLNTTELYTIDG